MKLPKKRPLIIGTVIAALLAVSLVETYALGLPGYAPALTYLAIAVAVFCVKRVDAIALLGNYFVMRGKPGRGVPLLKFATAKNTKSPAAYLNLAVMLLRQNEADAALALLAKAEARKPSVMTQKNIAVTKGSCYWVKGEIDAAIETMEAMRTRFDYVNANVLSTLAYLYILKKDYPKAKALSEEALADSPAAHAAWDNLGQIAYCENDDAAARAAFGKALELKPSYVDSLYFMGLVHERAGEGEAALACFSKAALADITPLNAVTKAQIETKLNAYKEDINDPSGD